MRRYLSFFMSLCLFLAALPLHHVTAAADVTKPVFESISVDKKQATAGDTVTISLKASDDVGIRWVYMYYQTPITKKGVHVGLEYNSETKAYEGTFNVTAQSESGLYKINELHIYDTSDNIQSLYMDTDYDLLQNGEFTVSGTNADITPPVFHWIKADKKEVTSGDTVKLTVKATDNTKIRSIVVFYESPITKKGGSVEFKYNQATDLFEGTIPIDEKTEAGLYIMDAIRIIDSSDNNYYLSNTEDPKKLQDGNFTVKGTSGADVTFPVFEGISVNQKEVTYGDKVKVSVHASDDQGIGWILAYYRTPITNRLETITCKYNQETGAYEATFEISTNVEAGTYKFDHILVRDTSENDLLVWDEDALAKGEFHVYTENNPPVFTNLTVDKKVMKLIETDQTIHITLHATDDTHLQDAVVYYLSPISKTKVAVPLTLNGSTFTGNFLIHSNTEAGSWKVNSLEIKDMNDNLTRVRTDSVDLSSGQFTILLDQTAPEKPVVNEVTDRVTVVQGTTEPRATVNVVVNGDIIGTGRAGSDKKFAITIPVQKAGTVLNIVAVDWAGNKSEPTKVPVVRGNPGWSLENGYWYYYDSDTYVKKTGWYKVGSTWYFSNNDGVMQTGWIKYKGSWYYLKNSGAMATGWLRLGPWYYFNSSGAMVTGWLKDHHKWYYLKSSGAMATGWTKVNNKWYYLQIFGDMLTGWFFYNGHWYFLQPNGALRPY